MATVFVKRMWEILNMSILYKVFKSFLKVETFFILYFFNSIDLSWLLIYFFHFSWKTVSYIHFFAISKRKNGNN